MPVFHTKTIESILEPVAQQVIKMSKMPSVLFFICFRLQIVLIGKFNHLSLENFENSTSRNIDIY